jgi:hypothetical protein
VLTLLKTFLQYPLGSPAFSSSGCPRTSQPPFSRGLAGPVREQEYRPSRRYLPQHHVVEERTDTCAIPNQLFSPLPIDRVVDLFPRQKMRHPTAKGAWNRQTARQGKQAPKSARRPTGESHPLFMPDPQSVGCLCGITAMAIPSFPPLKTRTCKASISGRPSPQRHMHEVPPLPDEKELPATGNECTKPAPLYYLQKQTAPD